MAAYRRVYDSSHLQADCQEPGSAAGPYARQSSLGCLQLFKVRVFVWRTIIKSHDALRFLGPLVICLIVAGKLFHTGGPATAKLPSRRVARERGTASVL